MDLRPPRPVRPRAGHSGAVIPTSVSQSGVSSPGSVPGKKDAFDQALVEEARCGLWVKSTAALFSRAVQEHML